MIDGFVVIDKPAGITSRDVVNRVQRLKRGIKIGHAGTLDPLATGVLPLAISSGAGANARHSIGTGIIGGMIGAVISASSPGHRFR